MAILLDSCYVKKVDIFFAKEMAGEM